MDDEPLDAEDEEQDAEERLVIEFSERLYDQRTWIRVAALSSIAMGVLLAFQGWTILYCWVPVVLGAMLYQCVPHIEDAHTSGSRYALHEALGKLASYLTVMAVTNLIVLAILALVSLGIIAYVWRYL